jgi:hypothetical protein
MPNPAADTIVLDAIGKFYAHGHGLVLPCLIVKHR